MALGLTALIIGLIFTIAFRHFDGSAMTNTLAGFLLGLFLLLLGGTVLLTQGRQTIVVDPRSRQIVIEETTPLGVKKRVIHFHEIVDTGIGYLGKRSNFVNFFYISLHLRNGKRYALFSPGRFYDGWSDRSAMEARQQELELMLKQDAGR